MEITAANPFEFKNQYNHSLHIRGGTSVQDQPEKLLPLWFYTNGELGKVTKVKILGSYL